MRRSVGTKRLVWLVLCAAALAAAWLVAGCGGDGDTAGEYYCPMHPTYVSDRPGDCPICNMRLVPRDQSAGEAAREHAAGGTEEHAGHEASGTGETSSMSGSPPGNVPGYATVTLDSQRQQLAGVQTALAVRDRLVRTVRTVGIVEPNETLLQHAHVKVGGFIEKLYVNATGQLVHRGAPAFELYSPELVASQEEFLRALEAARALGSSSLAETRRGSEDLLTSARRRLELYDVPPEFIAELERSGVPRRTVTMHVPATGYVVSKNVVDGDQVEPGTDLFTVADLSRVWVQADFYENEAQLVHVGKTAAIALPHEPGEMLTGKVAYVYPYVDPQSRTLDVRFEFANPGLKLKPGMFVDVVLEVESQEGVVVPESAVLDTGERQVTFVELGGGKFEPREVTTGLRGDGKVLVLAGVAAGEAVVTRANFLLDSESRLRGALAPDPHAGHGGAQP